MSSVARWSKPIAAATVRETALADAAMGDVLHDAGTRATNQRRAIAAKGLALQRGG